VLEISLNSLIDAQDMSVEQPFPLRDSGYESSVVCELKLRVCYLLLLLCYYCCVVLCCVVLCCVVLCCVVLCCVVLGKTELICSFFVPRELCFPRLICNALLPRLICNVLLPRLICNVYHLTPHLLFITSVLLMSFSAYNVSLYIRISIIPQPHQVFLFRSI
jgi:hypothetical protein